MLFFIATVGRSGSNWLCRTLAQSPTHRVEHEDADDRFRTSAIHGHAEFPLERFLSRGPDYGEVHGFLRYNLSGERAGLERSIPRRAALERNTRDVIRSWCRNEIAAGSTTAEEEFGAIAFEVLTQQRLLREWAESDPSARIFSLEKLTTNQAVLDELCDWLGLGFHPSPETRNIRQNPTRSHRPEWEWTPHREQVLARISERMGFDPIDILP